MDIQFSGFLDLLKRFGFIKKVTFLGCLAIFEKKIERTFQDF